MPQIYATQLVTTQSEESDRQLDRETKKIDPLFVWVSLTAEQSDIMRTRKVILNRLQSPLGGDIGWRNLSV